MKQFQGQGGCHQQPWYGLGAFVPCVEETLSWGARCQPAYPGVAWAVQGVQGSMRCPHGCVPQDVGLSAAKTHSWHQWISEFHPRTCLHSNIIEDRFGFIKVFVDFT